MLVDCSSTKIYISMIIANWLKIKTKLIKVLNLYLANDQKNVLNETSEEEILRLTNTYALKKKFRVTKLRYDIIFSMSCPEVRNKQVDWLVRTIFLKIGDMVTLYVHVLSRIEK